MVQLQQNPTSPWTKVRVEKRNTESWGASLIGGDYQGFLKSSLSGSLTTIMHTWLNWPSDSSQSNEGNVVLLLELAVNVFFFRIALVLFRTFFHICSHSRKEDEKSNSDRALTCLGVLKQLVGMAGNTWYYVGKASIQLSQCSDCAMLHRLAPRSASEWGKKRRVQSKQNGWTTIQLMLFSLPR